MELKRSRDNTMWDNDRLALLFTQYGLVGFWREYPIRNPETGRSFRIDFVWNAPSIRKGGTSEISLLIGNGRKVAVEFRGGLTVGGWHLGIARYAGDCRKARRLSYLGWCYMPLTVLDMNKPALVIEEIKQALGMPNQYEKFLVISH